jgi:type IV pilus assembly protein PilM
MFRKKENLIGLDIGSHSIKMVQVGVTGGPVRLLNVGLAQVGSEGSSDARVGRAEAVGKAIQQLVAHLKVRERLVASSMSGYEVMIKKIELPAMGEDELSRRMQSELGQYIPYNIEEVDVDYQILEMAKDRPTHMEVLLVAAKKESVREYINMIRSGGLDAMVMDVDFFALSNAFEVTHGMGGAESIVLLDIGASKSIMNIVMRGVPIFSRGISMGGAQITESIMDHFQIGFEEAERVKMGESSLALNQDELQNIYVSTIRKWLGEFKRAIDFYYSNFPDHRISKIYLSGGSCRVAGLDRVFHENTNIDVEIFNPFIHLEYDTKVFDPEYVEYIGPQMAIALGLALRKTKEK